MNVTLVHNAIIEGKWYTAGDPIEKSILPPNMLKYIVKPPKPRTESLEINLVHGYNKRYSVDSEGWMMPTVAQQAAQMKAEIEQEEYIQDQANPKLSPDVEADLEEAQKDYQYQVRREALDMECQARNADSLADDLRAKQDSEVESGAFDVLDSDYSFREVSNDDSADTKPKRKTEPVQSANLKEILCQTIRKVSARRQRSGFERRREFVQDIAEESFACRGTLH